jgi:hypothetical protein
MRTCARCRENALNLQRHLSAVGAITTLVLCVGALLGSQVTSATSAPSYGAQINVLKKQVSHLRAQVRSFGELTNDLTGQVETQQKKIAVLALQGVRTQTEFEFAQANGGTATASPRCTRGKATGGGGLFTDPSGADTTVYSYPADDGVSWNIAMARRTATGTGTLKAYVVCSLLSFSP